LLDSSQTADRNSKPPPRRGTVSRRAHRPQDCSPKDSYASRPRSGQPKALECHSLGAHLLDFPQARSHFTQLDLFCNDRSYCAKKVELQRKEVILLCQEF
jgi:hypothetical protein